MAKKKIYYNEEAPINDEELALEIYKLISNAPILGIDINKIPKDTDAHYKDVILSHFFNNWTLLHYVDIMETKTKLNLFLPKNADTYSIIVDNPDLKQKKDKHFYVVFKHELMEKSKADKLIADRNAFKKCNLPKILCYNHKKETDFEVDYTECSCHNEDYGKDLLAEKNLWNNFIIPKVDEAIRVCKDNINKQAREKFKTELQPDAKKFADALITYCEIVRNLSDIHKIADHFITINKWINGDTIPASHLLVLFNTDTQVGRNGKTWRMNLEQTYMNENGFLSSSNPLTNNGLGSINDLSDNLFYKDEYAFEDSTKEFLKNINQNKKPKITARVLYKGTQTIVNDVIIYLCCHNGRPAESIVSNNRTAYTVRCTDAKYSENIQHLTNIYSDPLEQNEQALKNIYYKKLFGALVKNAVPYNKKMLFEEQIIKFSSQLLSTLEHFHGGCVTFGKLINYLGKQTYFSLEKAKTEFHDLYNYLKANQPEYITGESKKNWDERGVNLSMQSDDGSLIDLLEKNNSAVTVETNYELIDRTKLKNYIYSLFDLDPNEPETDFEKEPETTAVVSESTPTVDIDKEQKAYNELCELFIPVTKTKIGYPYTDSNTGETLELLFEGVNIPDVEPTAGHKSRFSLDNMMLMPRFLVEYDPPSDTSIEEIKKIKDQTLQLIKDLPTFRVVDSGNKSIHIMFCFDYESHPENIEEYKFAVQCAVQELNLPDKIGVAELDKKVLVDPSRICRRPNVLRDNGKMQTLISMDKKQIHSNWKEKYKQHCEKEQQKKNRQEILNKPIFNFSNVKTTTSGSVEEFIQNYVNKHNLSWSEGHRHEVASTIAGACKAAGFGAQESITAIEKVFDCSDDPTITCNLDKLF